MRILVAYANTTDLLDLVEDVALEVDMAYKRNYSQTTGEGKYQKSAKQKKNRASRNAAARKMKCPKGKEVDHKDRNPRNNKKSNLRCLSKSKNRSFKRK